MASPTRVTGRELAGVLIASLLVVGALVALTAAEGALGIPRNDDWSFIRNAFNLHDSGTIAVTGWVQMLLIGQLLIAYPVLAITGPSIIALQLVGAAFGVLLLVASYLLARTMLAVRWAALAAAVLAVGPLFGTLTVSFMTDVPAAALQVLTVLLGVHGLRASASRGWLVAAGVVGVAAFSVREYGVVALGVVALLVLVKRRAAGLSWRFVSAWLVVLVALGLLLVLWRGGQLTENASAFGPNLEGLQLMAALPLTLGLLLLPVTAWLDPRGLLRRAWSGSRGLTVAALLVVLAGAATTRFSFLGNYLSGTGPYSQSTLGDPPLLLPRPVWLLLTALALLSACALALLVVLAVTALLARARVDGPWPAFRRTIDEQTGASAAALYVLATVLLITVAASLLRIPVFDRYFVGIIAPAAAVALWIGIRHGLIWKGATRAIGWAGLVVLALVGLVSVATAAAVDAARWSLATQAAAVLDVAPGNIDGGFEWFSYQTNGSPRPVDAGTRWTWWTTQRDNRAVCATVMFAGGVLRTDAARPDPALAPLLSLTITPLPGITRELIVVPGPDRCGG